MNLNPNYYSSTTGNFIKDTRYNNSENLNLDLYNTTQNFHDYHKNIQSTSSSLISGNTTSYEITDKNTFHNPFIRNNNENLSFERRYQIIEEIKNEYLNKEPNYIIQKDIIRNDYKSSNPIIINNKINQDENDELVHLTSKKFTNYDKNNQEDEKQEIISNNIIESNNDNPNNNYNNNYIQNFNNENHMNYNNSINENQMNYNNNINENQMNYNNNNIHNENQMNYNLNQNNIRKENINKPLKDKNVTSQFKVIFPKEKKGLDELNDVTEERTENYISMENEINKITESMEKENNNKNNIKKEKNKNGKKRTKSKLKKKKYFDSTKINNTDKIVPSYKYFSTLDELNDYSNEEKIEKLFENNLNLYQELTEARNKIEILNEELRRKNGESEDKFRGYLLDENNKLMNKNKENEKIIDYLLRKLNMRKKPKKINHSYKTLYHYDDIKKEVRREGRSNSGKKNNINSNIIYDYNTSLMKSNNLNNLSSSNFNSSNYQKKKKSKLTSPKRVKSKKKELSLDDLNNENDILEIRKKKRPKTSKHLKSPNNKNRNITDFYDYYGSKGVDRTKTCFACLFGNSNYTKGYSPIACSPNYK